MILLIREISDLRVDAARTRGRIDSLERAVTGLPEEYQESIRRTVREDEWFREEVALAPRMAAAERELAACRSDVRRAGVAASGDAVGQTLSLLARAGFLVKGRMPGKDIQHVPPGPWEENGFEEKNPKQPLPAVSYAPAWDLEEMNASVSVIAEGLEDARASVADLETLLNGAVTKPELNVRSRQSRWLAIAKGNRIRPTKMCSSFLRC
jgi:hypothetical protein